MDLARKMSRSEFKQLSDDEKKERRRLQQRIRDKKYSDANKEKITERDRKYKQTPNGKKVNTLCSWKSIGLQESKEVLDIIYELWQTQELCNACDCVLTRNGDRSSTDASMDHCHITHRFRHIICRACNNHDRWKQYFC